MKAHDIRSCFTNYFEENGHQKLPSSSLTPIDDPSLLFTNAGMNQFKEYFTGQSHPKHLRTTTIQKCVRAGGKHNDLENVGLTTRHHTFFEMLGNFSFGDYFKKDAIHFAWEFLTKKLNIDKNRLIITVHHSDNESKNIWHRQEKVPLSRIFTRGDKDNFWEMGEVGPCGPCSEIFYDYGKQYATSESSTTPLDDEERYVEIWNLVFMQFEKNKTGTSKLPKPSIDTGAGLERLATLMQEKYWNYDCDLFTHIISSLEEMSKRKYQGELAQNFRVVSDHIRSATMLMTDGVIPSNEGRGYVLRRIIRRAVRHLKKLDKKNTRLSLLVPTVFETLGHEYPENFSNQSLAVKFLDIEEDKFLETLHSGEKFLEQALSKINNSILPGEIAFKLYDTYGFPLDLTEIILKEKNMRLNRKGFDTAMENQRKSSKKSWKGEFSITENKKLFSGIKEKFNKTSFIGYQKLSGQGTLLFKEKVGDLYALVFDQTPFYGESGGQIGDCGYIYEGEKVLAEIIDTQKPIDGLHVLYSKNASKLELKKSYKQIVDEKKRKLTTINHSATHLLQSALIEILGNHIKQAGSHVNEERLRFDFTHPTALKEDEIDLIEKHVNNNIQAAYDVSFKVMPKEQATQKGAIAMFGEKYGNHVRVVEMGKASFELCGGTHVTNLLEIGLFNITQETSLSSGVRRIEAITCNNASLKLRKRSKLLKKIEIQLSGSEENSLEKIHSLKEKVKYLNRENQQLKDKIQSLESHVLIENPKKLGHYLFKVAEAPEELDLRKLSDQFISKYPNGILILYQKRKGKLSLLMRTNKNHSSIHCGNILGNALKKIDGRGGGRPDMAQGSSEQNINREKLIQDIISQIEGLKK